MDSNKTNLFFQLLRLGLGTEENEGDKSVGIYALNSEAIDWSGIYTLSIQQGVATILFDGLQLLQNKLAPRNVLMKLYAYTLQVERHNSKQVDTISQLAKFYASYDIRMMLLKGYGLGLLYPHPNHRPCGDIDIWLYGEAQRADKLLETENGINVNKEYNYHSVFYMGNIMVENHYDFFNTRAHRSNQEVEKELMMLVKEKQESLCIDNTDVYVASANFNALFLLRHTGIHFAASEITLRHVVDWGMFIKRYYKEIDWDWFVAYTKKQNMYSFLCCLNSICVEYLGISADIFPALKRDKKLEMRILFDTLNPPFANKSDIGSSFIKDRFFRMRRWWNNRWKHTLIYKEGLTLTFLIHAISLLRSPKLKGL